MRTPFKLLQKILAFLVLTGLVFFALLSMMVRILLPSIDKTEMETFLSNQLDALVQIDHFSASWSGADPSFQIKKIKLFDKPTGTLQATVDTTFATLNLVKSLYALRPEFKRLNLSGLNLAILQSEEDTFSIRGLQDVKGIVPSTVDLNDLIFWFLTQEHVVLRNSTLIWQKKDNTQLPFFVKQISILPKKTLEITADVLLAEKKSVPILLVAKLIKPAKQWNQMTGEGYLKTGNLPITRIGTNFDFFSLEDGIIQTELWGSFKQGVVEIFGQTKASSVKLSPSLPSAKPLFIDETHLDFFFHKNQHAAELATEIHSLKLNREPWPIHNLHFLRNSTEQKIQLYATSLTLSQLARVGTFPKLTSFLQKNFLQGNLKHIWFEQDQKKGSFLVSTDFENLKMPAKEILPAFSNVSGKLVLTPTTAQGIVNAKKVMLSFPTLFRSSHQAEILSGTINWSNQESAWEVSSDFYLKNEDGEAWGEFTLEDSALDNQSPIIRLLTTFKKINGAHQSRYLPTSLMPTKTVAWLDKSIKKIQLGSGSMVMAGPIQRFPFPHQEGHFEVNSTFEGLTLDYAPHWPPIENGRGALWFEGNGMEITLNGGMLSKTNIVHLVGKIPDFSAEAVWLHLNGKTRGGGDDALHVLTRSTLLPHRESLNMSLQGDITLDLGLSVALNKDIKFKLLGDVQFRNNALILKPLVQSIKQINGEIKFTENDMTSNNLTGELFGNMQSFEISTKTVKSSPIVEIKTKGTLPVSSLPTEQTQALAGNVRGEAHYDATIRFVNAFSKEDTKTEAEISTDLRGIESNFPAPLNKTKKQIMPLRIQINRPSPNSPWELLATLNKTNRLNLIWQPNTPPSAKVVLNKIDLADWKGAASGSPPFPRLQVFTPQLRLAQFLFPNTLLDIRPQENGFVVGFNGSTIEGQAKIPPKGVNTPILIELQKVKLTPKEEDAKKTSSPTDIPAFFLHAKETFYDEKALGEVNLEITKEAQGISIQKLEFKHPSLKTTLTGKWISENKNEQTHLQGTLTTPNFEAFLKTFGFAPAIKSSNAKAEVNLNWNGSPGTFSLKKLRGDIEIDLKQGSLLNVEPGGTSRLFGLLSLQTLVRRLTLDFSDLFGKGLSFDRIHGNFRLDDGNAYTCDTLLVGPSTRIILQGRTGLYAKDYEQIASVSAKFFNTVPSVIVGIINPLAGAATWLGSQILETPLGAFTSVGYEITGSWDNPVVKQTALPKALQPWKIIPKLIPFFPVGQNKDISKFCQPR